MIEPTEKKVSGVVFKIQANMDPKHRDRIAFMRLASGHFRRGMQLKHVRSGKMIAMSAPVLFLARDRELAEQYGVSRFMSKPFSNSDMLAAVRELAGGRIGDT